MKKALINIMGKVLTLLTVLAIFASCNDYLNNREDLVKTEDKVFEKFSSYQGYIEYMYTFIIDYNRFALTTTMNLAGEVVGSEGMTWTSYNRAQNGRYYLWMSDDYGGGYGAMQSIFYNDAINDPLTNRDEDDGEYTGEWPDSWQGIRIANKTIANIDKLKEPKEGEKDILLGQAYFFRAYFHWLLFKTWGGMPYIDKVISDSDHPGNYSRISPQEMADKMVIDFDKAAEYLPDNWDEHPVGQYTLGENVGRITRSAALAMKAKVLLYAGSPLFAGFSDKPFSYDNEYVERAAIAAGEFISQYENQHALEPWGPNGDDYAHMFASKDGVLPWANEFIVARNMGIGGPGLFSGRIARTYSPNRGVWGGGTCCGMESLNQQYVDKFEMADGTIYKSGVESVGGYDEDNTKRWENRDPRFRRNVFVDGDSAGYDENLVLQLYDGGRERIWSEGTVQLSPYVIRKYWPIGVNNVDRDFDNFNITTPHLRMGEMYLIYAEAVTVAYNDPNRTAGGCNLTAVDAVNKVRNRANMPDAISTAPGYAIASYDEAAAGEHNFLSLIRNEFWVELCFEGSWWYNMRRWYLMHYDESKYLVDMRFDKEYTYVQRDTINNLVFENPKHYWVPLHRDDAAMFEGFHQNPGWE